MKPSGQDSGLRLDARLQALFGGLDTSAGFEASVLARVKVEANAALDHERIERARMEESRRYGEARSELSLSSSLREFWGRYFGRWVTLETAGAAVLLGFVLQFAWSRLPAEWVGQISQLSEYTPQLLSALGALMALTPLAVVGFKRYRQQSMA